jgi:hypothetical protein
MHDLAAAHKLRYVSSATLSDNLEEFLHDRVRETVLSESDPTIRQTLQDLATNQRFRRDLFCRGTTRMTSVELSQQFRQLRVAPREMPQQKERVYPTSFGAIHFKANRCAAIEDALASGPQELGTVQDLHSLQSRELLQAIVLLLEADRIGIDRGGAGKQAENICRDVNRSLAAMQSTGRPYWVRTAPSIGTAVSFSYAEALIESALQTDPEADPLPALAAGLSEVNYPLDGDPAAVLQAYLLRRPALQRLGAIES